MRPERIGRRAGEHGHPLLPLGGLGCGLIGGEGGIHRDV